LALDEGSITGRLTFRSAQVTVNPGVGGGPRSVRVPQGGLGRVEIVVLSDRGEIGNAIVERQADPTASTTEYDFTVPVPAALEGQTLAALTLRYSMRGATVMPAGGYLQLNGSSYLDVPVRQVPAGEI
jgi:hypothetical protein